MSDEAYQKVAKVLDTLPNGFPSTESGVEIKLLKKIFEPEEAELFCDMRLSFETSEQVAERTGRPLEGLEEMLTMMAERGQLFSIKLGDARVFKMVPWVFGIYEFQLGRLDREFVELIEEFAPVFGRQFFSKSPQMMQTLPIEEELSVEQEAMAYDRVSTLVESSESFRVMECICKKEKGLMDHPCAKPTEVCMAFAPLPDIFQDDDQGRVITKDEAKAILKKAEEAGMVHMTSNFQNGRLFICNCCGCCCGVLSGIHNLGIPASQVVNSHHYAVIDPDACITCGMCADERCQVDAIEEGEDAYQITVDKCIGCGLCVTTCPTDAIKLVHKSPEKIAPPPLDETEWFRQRGKLRGVDFSRYE
ncbi:MAG: 4Fe-4S dicluster-binding protein [Desulfobacterales bacterium]